MTAGENEMKKGHVTVKTREGVDLGEMRVDDFGEKLLEQMPKPNEAYNEFYSRVWKAENYVGKSAPPAQPKAQAAVKAKPSAPVPKEPKFVDVPYVGAPSLPVRHFTETLTDLEAKISKMSD